MASLSSVFDDWTPPVRECATDDCAESFEDRGRFTYERSVASGWFCQRNGTVWCPNHTPEWVAAWREKKGSQS